MREPASQGVGRARNVEQEGGFIPMAGGLSAKAPCNGKAGSRETIFPHAPGCCRGMRMRTMDYGAGTVNMRIRALLVSATKMFPRTSTATPKG